MMNTILLLFHYPVFKDIFKQILGLPFANKTSGVELAINAVLVGVVTFLVVKPMLSYIRQRNFLTGDWYNQQPHYWIVKEKQPEGEINQYEEVDEKHYLRYYFQPNNEVYEFFPGITQPVYKQYQLDERNHILTITNPNNLQDQIKGKYQLLDNITLEWRVENEKKKVRLTKQKLK